VGTVGSTILYVEKKTCEFAVQAARSAGFPSTIGAGFAEIGFIFESFTSSSSILRCSCGWGRLVRVMMQFSHAAGQRRRTQTAAWQRVIICGNIEEFCQYLWGTTQNRQLITDSASRQPNRQPRNHLLGRDLGLFLASKSCVSVGP
jgi:hypothetical protein